ncbi:MAG: hypothetical protein U0974_11840 [Gemmatimonadales bacterium]|nr:hypothetical protein [Gemmatimonadales bacterium]MDZ4390407.1 hypothetical protein [Gemmatimonadales bacterium]
MATRKGAAQATTSEKPQRMSIYAALGSEAGDGEDVGGRVPVLRTGVMTEQEARKFAEGVVAAAQQLDVPGWAEARLASASAPTWGETGLLDAEAADDWDESDDEEDVEPDEDDLFGGGDD